MAIENTKKVNMENANRIVSDALKKNEEFKKSVQIFSQDRNDDTWRECMTNLLRIVHEDGMLLAPISMDGEGDDKNILFRLLESEDGKQLFPLFTSMDEVVKKNPQNTAALPARKLLKEFMKMEDVEAIWIDPWGDPFILRKEHAESLLDTDEKIFYDRRGIYFERGNILDIDCDCVVNSADPMFNDGGGVDHVIYEAAGDELLDRLDEMESLHLGHAVMTPAYNLPRKAIIHTCGPVYDETNPDIKSLSQCYLSSLELAKKANMHSIVFPAISTGSSGFPKELAAKVAVSNISYWMDQNKGYGIAVILISHDDEMYEAYSDFVKQAKEEESKEM
ncbi:MAG: macro domain-containing protein [Lachnospiraceae bacterium]|nr:macro domain-containing protein [Lachnospiraceae bacterium]